ncbi:MAG: hypothetical protein WD906_01335 [Anaerolineales bacterium]
MEYGAILRRAWEITWKHKALWILGILANCGKGGGGTGGGGNFSGSGLDPAEVGPASQELTQFLERLGNQETLWLFLLGIGLLILVLSLLFLALGVIGQGGLIAAFHRSDQGPSVSLGEAFTEGVSHFWRMLGAQLLIGLIVLAIFLALAIPAVGLAIFTLGLGLLCLVPVFVVIVVVIVLASTIYFQFVQMAIVVEGNGVMGSLRRALDVIRSSLGPVLVMGVILLVGTFVISAVIALPLLAAALPLVTGFILGEQAASAGIGLAVVCFVGYLPVLIVLQGILTTFVTGSWTLTYLRLIERPRPAPIAGI